MLLAVLKDSDSPTVVRTGVVVDDSGIVSNFDAIFAFFTLNAKYRQEVTISIVGLHRYHLSYF